jgi:DNA modification methylase
MEIREIAIRDIRPAPYNPRKDLRPGDPEYQKLQEVIGHFDLVQPLVWNKRTENLVAGHQRLKILKRRGDLTVQVVVVDLDEHEEKALNIALNNVKGDWDETKLSEVLQELRCADFDLALTGFSVEELDKLLAPLTIGQTDEDTVPEPVWQPVTIVGDEWLLGRHRLRCGDATNVRNVQSLLNGEIPNIMITDPPYGVKYDADWRNRALIKANRSTGPVLNDDRADWRQALLLYPGPVVYLWHAGTKAHIVGQSLEAAGFCIRSQIVYVKPHFCIGRGHYHVQHEPCYYAVRTGETADWQGDRKQTTVWEIHNGWSQGAPRKPEDARTVHSTQKPVECMRRPLLNHTRIGESAYDPFGGSGTSLIAAETCGRICYAMELNPIYVDVTIRRWEAFTGRKATLETNGKTFEAIAKEREV